MQRFVAVILVGLFTAACSDDSGQTDPRDAGFDQDAVVGDGGLTDAAARDAVTDDAGNAGPTVTQWQPFQVTTLKANDEHRWDEFPVQVTFTHEGDDVQLILDGYWTGGHSWAVRFAATQTGRWTWNASTDTSDPGLAGSGVFTAVAPTSDEVAANANFHGHVHTNGRYFQYGDGTPFLPLGDTFWKFNTMLPLGDLASGLPSYLADRSAKGFNAVLIEYIEAHPDENDNEGGYLWDPDTQPPDSPTVDWSEINPAYFDSLDPRIQAFWDHGLVIFGHPFWIVEQPDITVAQAVNISRYLLARYGAYNLVWSLTGEFHEACSHNAIFCDNDFAGVADLGRWVGGSNGTNPARPGFNPFGHPMSVHPGGYDVGAPDPNIETSRIFDGEDWLDHHWIQTYLETDKIVYRVSELRGTVPNGLTSHLPVLLAEPAYEGYTNAQYTDWDQGSGAAKQASMARREAWTSMFVGAAGHMYGAKGVWGADNPDALNFVGSSMIHYVKDLLLALGWPALVPAACVETNAGGSWAPPALDYPSNAGDRNAVLTYTYAPRCLMQDGQTLAVYIPAGNETRPIRAMMLSGLEYRARWFNPRDGTSADINGGNPVNTDHDDLYRIPDRPSPSNDDWVIVLTRQ